MIFAGKIDLMFDHNIWLCFFSSALSFGTVIIMQLARSRIKIKLPEIMHELFTRNFYCQLKANNMDLHIALTKLESLIFDK
jgi:hypothetical protein